MKFLHIADLHIGKTLNGFPLLEDQIHILQQIVEMVRTHRPSAVLIAGDVYDKPTPAPDAVRAFDRFLTALSRESVAILAISGNHDSPERMGFAGEILKEQNVHLYGPFDGKAHIVTLRDEGGEVDFYLLPFIRPAMVRGYFDADTHEAAVRAALAATQGHPERRAVLVAHQFFCSAGQDPERSESEIDAVGGLDSVDVSAVDGFDYVALGHLHGPQRMTRDTIRYAGSPLKYSFSECNHKKSAALVDLGKSGEVSVTLLPFAPLRDLRRISGPIERLTDPVVVAEANPQDYLYVTLTDENEVIDAIGKLRSVYPHVCALDFSNARTHAGMEWEGPSLENRSPLELFCALYQAQNGTEVPGHELRWLQRLLDGMEEES